jgi:succinate dehydrogenase assembly factor 2
LKSNVLREDIIEKEALDVKRKRLMYKSTKRGTLENCILLSKFAKNHLAALDEEELKTFDKLLSEDDWDIYYWCVGRTPVPEVYKGRMFDLLRRELNKSD